MPASCVIAFFHTTWDVAIARELRDRQYCLIRAGPNWAVDLGGQLVAWDTAGLRALVRRVGRGGRCAAAADNFVRGTEGGFFGTRKVLNPAVVRLAGTTGAPLVTLWPTYDRGVLRFELGRPIAASTCAELPDEALRIVRQFFEDAVRRDVAGWPRIVFFLERAVGAND
jgi:lauroyl/myristoyl acyltransferase